MTLRYIKCLLTCVSLFYVYIYMSFFYIDILRIRIVTNPYHSDDTANYDIATLTSP